MTKKITLTVFALLCFLNLFANKSEKAPPGVYIQNIETSVTIDIPKDVNDTLITIKHNQEIIEADISNGKATFNYSFNDSGDQHIDVIVQGKSNIYTFGVIPLWLSVIPPLIAIFFALAFKEVYSALLLGILSGTFILFFYAGDGVLGALLNGLLDIVDNRVISTMTDRDHIAIIVFSMLIGGMVSLITKNGGMTGVVNKLSKYASTPRSGQLITWFMGIAIFFDDYANTLVVGNTMRPITDRLKISREKLAYIVDSTAAPIAAIAFITTWIGAELSYIVSGTENLGIDESPYNILLSSIPYSFYPVFTLVFMFMLIMKRRDFGPMHRVETAARKNPPTDNLQPHSQSNAGSVAKGKERWYNAAIPVLIIIFGTIIGLLYTGWDSALWADNTKGFAAKLSGVIGAADPYKALLWSSTLGVLTAVVLTIGQRIMSLKDATESVIDGFKIMLTAMLILVLAWSLAGVTADLHTADFLSQLLTGANIPTFLLPAIVFMLSALVAFSTGSSWGTMAILYPLVLPTTWMLTKSAGLPPNEAMNIFYNVTASVLAGSVLGDHCSPISDTTILSSLASSCNHISHVNTQLPYSLTVGAVSVVMGTISAAFNLSPVIVFIPGFIILYFVVAKWGKPVQDFS
jgi:Na+/H+ antiporter NhaC